MSLSRRLACLVVSSVFVCSVTRGEPLTLVRDGSARVVILVEEAAQAGAAVRNKAGREIPSARHHEWKAALDLALYIEKMTGARPPVITGEAEVSAALQAETPALVVGELALRVRPALREELKKAARPAKVFDSDAILLRREGTKVFLAGSNDRSHYFAVAKLLREWGCRWYLPTEFGEAIPERPELTIDKLEIAYAPPFEQRGCQVTQGGSEEGLADFQLRNFMSGKREASHLYLWGALKALVPPEGTLADVPLAAPETAAHLATKLEKAFAEGKPIVLSAANAVQLPGAEVDRALSAGLMDKFFRAPLLTDPLWVLYNAVAETLQERHPASPSTIEIRADANFTLPPQRELPTNGRLLVDLVPQDIDPNHGIGDPRSPSKEEFAGILHQWARKMEGRVLIHDREPAMTLWRDLPNPSHHVFARDVRRYREEGILGVRTESRGAFATTFLNLHLRAQLLWNPDEEAAALLEEFYPKFYGPLAEPMRAYWSTLFQAWEETLVTEHEYYVIPAIYGPERVETLRGHLAAARKLAGPLRDEPRARPFLDRLEFTEKSFAVIDRYSAMLHAANTEADYPRAVQLGREALAARVALAEMNPIFTTRLVGKGAEPAEPLENANPALLAGEVRQLIELEELTNGTKGTKIGELPLQWAFRRDPRDTGVARAFARQVADLSYWEKQGAGYAALEKRKDYPTTEWELLRTDLYAQAQGIRHPDGQSFTGYLWYKTPVELPPGAASETARIRFPGLFGEAWLYVNGELVAHRPQSAIWWENSYRFDWDAPLGGKLKPGGNDITLRVYNPHHHGGIFRRPFLYQPTTPAP